MGNIARVFVRDLKRLAKAPAAWSVALFLIVLPSLYTWFNVAGFWNPYDNTGNLRVCVVNEDVPIDDKTLGHLDVGSQVCDQLAENTQLAWAFVSREEALEEVNAGTAYAAFIIPEDFSADIATLTTGNFQQPTLEYYVNEKTGPVSPKITDTGASTLDTSINDAFFSTVSSTVASALDESLGRARQKLENTQSQATQNVDEAIAGIEDARKTLADLGSTIEDARGKAQSAAGALDSAQGSVDTAAKRLSKASDLAASANTSLATTSGKINTALDDGAAQLAEASSKTSLAMGETASAIEAAKNALGIPSANNAIATADFSDVIALLEQLKATATDEQKTRIDKAIAALKDAHQVSSDWTQLAKDLDAAAASAQGASDPVTALVQTALSNADSYRTQLTGKAVPAISSSIAAITSATGNLSAAVASQKLVIEQAKTAISQLDSTLTLASDAISSTDVVLVGLKDDLELVRNDLSSLTSANSISKLFGDNGIDPDKVADFMLSPTQITHEELYPINAYGSAMAPLFINLTLWIGVFMLMVIIRLEVDDEGIENLTIAQRTFGRWLFLAILASLQAVVCCTGCLIMGVQSVSPGMFILTAIIASLAYLAIQYTLSTTLQHVGKALCIILVFVQIPGATGLYPIEMTPDFFHVIYPMFPFTYGINAIRETTCGFYGNTWISCVGVLVAFLVAFIAIGTLARPYMTNLNRLFAREIEDSDIINGEAIQLPARRYRMSQVIRALSNHDEYRDAIEARVTRFIALYPNLIRGALVAGIAVPIITTVILAMLNTDKVIVLTTWLVWLILIVAYLIVVEYLRDYLGHLVSLEGMNEQEIRALYANRNLFTRVQPITKRLTGLGKKPEADAKDERAEESEGVEGDGGASDGGADDTADEQNANPEATVPEEANTSTQGEETSQAPEDEETESTKQTTANPVHSTAEEGGDQ